MAQLGDLVRAKALLRRAARAFGPKEAVARARCVVAEADVVLVSRDLGWPAKTLDAAWATLEEQGDQVNAAYARYLEVRRLLLIGRIDDTLVVRAFGAKLADESHRTRLRVEVGRLRRVLRTLADVSATKRGFALAPRHPREVVVLTRPVEEEHAAVLAFLADRESWSSSALALALGTSQRTVQRALDSLAAAGKVQSFGRGRARRSMNPPVPGFTTTLLLPVPLPID
jgi:DNA-binding transcriptional ArsR family regulator